MLGKIEKFKLPATIAASSLVAFAIGTALGIYLKNQGFFKTQTHSKTAAPLSPFAELSSEKIFKKSQRPQSTPTANLPDPFHLLLLGLDKRYKEQESYRTDSIMVISILKETKKVILTSIPRDLWISGSKINSFYCGEGFDKFKERVEKIIGVEPHRYITADFDAMVWAIDEFGRATPNIERSFTDYNYPDDRPNAPHPPSFQAGEQTLNGEEALQYCRSRKGGNGEGSDFRRMHRQQNLLVNLPESFHQSNLAKLGVEALYNLITGHLETNLKVTEVATLLKLLKDHQSYTIENVVLETSNFLYRPLASRYSGAYALRPNGESFEAIHQHISEKLSTSTPTPITPACSTCGR